jgi:hypothetical protein
MLVLDNAVNNAKQIEITEIHSTIHPPATIMANAKNPNPAVLPLNTLTLNKNSAPANPASAEESKTPTH